MPKCAENSLRPGQRESKFFTTNQRPESGASRVRLYLGSSRLFRPDTARVNKGWRVTIPADTTHLQENWPFPKCNRMTHAPHGVKVEAQIMNGIQDLSQNLI